MKHERYGYFFGYGADREPEMIKAIIGHKAELVCKAVLDDYQLRIQDISEVKASGGNPQQILRNCWGEDFKSYVIVPKIGGKVEGSVFKISLHERHLIDSWELVQLGWYQRIFVMAIGLDGQKYHAETQVLAHGQNAKIISQGLRYDSWLEPKNLLIKNAKDTIKKLGNTQ